MIGMWPVCCLIFFCTMNARKALLWSVVGGYLILPSATALKAPGIPALDKDSTISLGVLLGAFLVARRVNKANSAIFYLCLAALFVLAPFATAFMNRDPISNPVIYIPGLTMYDGLSMSISKLLLIIPFFAARRLLGDAVGHRLVLVGLLGAMLVYSIPILFEIRLSPQIHHSVYGFYQHSFLQQMREGGFRAMVFLSHGLVAALFLGMAVTAAIVLGRQRERIFRAPARIAAIYLSVVLVLQKSLGAALIAGFLGLFALASKPRKQLTIAAIVATVVLSYPILRSAEVIPIDAIRTVAVSKGEDRLASFNFRLENEERLLARANERPIFGWGSWGRNRVFNLQTGRDMSVTDGAWVISLGSDGWVGYIALFGLLGFPLIRLRSASKKAESISPYTAGLAVLLAFNLIDLIPNASITPFTWLIAGALSAYRPGLRGNTDTQGPFSEVSELKGQGQGIAQ